LTSPRGKLKYNSHLDRKQANIYIEIPFFIEVMVEYVYLSSFGVKNIVEKEKVLMDEKWKIL
jgi:hypothetical protein